MNTSPPDPDEPRTASSRFGYDPLAEELLDQQDARYRHVGGPGSAGAKLLDGFQRWAIVLAVGAIIAALVVFGLTNDSVRVSSLEPGDCFEVVSRRSAKNVTPIDCSLPHGGETLTDLDGLHSDALPACQAELDRVLDTTRSGNATVPSDARAALIGGVLLHRCVVLSESGALIGSLVSP